MKNTLHDELEKALFAINEQNTCLLDVLDRDTSELLFATAGFAAIALRKQWQSDMQYLEAELAHNQALTKKEKAGLKSTISDMQFTLDVLGQMSIPLCHIEYEIAGSEDTDNWYESATKMQVETNA